MLKPRRLHLHNESTPSQKPFASREDYDLGFKNFSLCRSWFTFEIENSDIENVKSGLSLSVKLIKKKYVII